jgi:hypothetical protein
MLDSDHLPVMFTILEPVRMREVVDPIEKQTYWDLFQSLTSELI